jgi:serine/threonine protein kinase
MTTTNNNTMPTQQQQAAFISELATLELGVHDEVPKVRFSQVRVEEVIEGGDFCVYTGRYQCHYYTNQAAAGRGLGASAVLGVGDNKHNNNNNNTHYALKCIKSADNNNNNTRTKDLLRKRALMLAKETKILSQVHHHEHIRTLHAISKKSLSQALIMAADGAANNNHGLGYFMLLDVIPETLRERMEVWRRELLQQRSWSRVSFPWRPQSQPQQHDPTNASIMERIQKVAVGVAKAMEYLHQQNIIFGAIHNPDTIGFDQEGVVKLIDLSTAASASSLSSPSDETSSRNDGATLEQQQGGYSYASDVSLYGWLLWELVTLQTPTPKTATTTKPSTLSMSMIPSSEAFRSTGIKSLIQYCWSSLEEDASHDHQQHQPLPTFRGIVKRLLEVTASEQHQPLSTPATITTSSISTTRNEQQQQPLKIITKPAPSQQQQQRNPKLGLSWFQKSRRRRPAVLVVDDLDRGRHNPISLESMEIKESPTSTTTTSTTGSSTTLKTTTSKVVHVPITKQPPPATPKSSPPPPLSLSPQKSSTIVVAPITKQPPSTEEPARDRKRRLEASLRVANTSISEQEKAVVSETAEKKSHADQNAESSVAVIREDVTEEKTTERPTTEEMPDVIESAPVKETPPTLSSSRQKTGFWFFRKSRRQVVNELDRGRHHCNILLEMDISGSTAPETVVDMDVRGTTSIPEVAVHH